jgi:hypothetical protein
MVGRQKHVLRDLLCHTAFATASPALGAVSPRTEEDNPPLPQTSGPDEFFTAKYLLKIRQVFRFTIIFVKNNRLK